MNSKFTSSGLRLLRCFFHHRISLSLRLEPSFLSTRPLEIRFLSPSFVSRGGRKSVKSVNEKYIEEEADFGGDIGSVVMVPIKALGGEGCRVVVTEVHKEATKSYRAYAISVLLGRTLPNVLGGLKLVHLRIP